MAKNQKRNTTPFLNFCCCCRNSKNRRDSLTSSLFELWHEQKVNNKFLKFCIWQLVFSNQLMKKRKKNYLPRMHEAMYGIKMRNSPMCNCSGQNCVEKGCFTQFSMPEWTIHKLLTQKHWNSLSFPIGNPRFLMSSFCLSN